MNFITASALRFSAMCLCAALLVLEHLRFALRAKRERGTRPALIALAVPLAGLVMAWRSGARTSTILYGLFALGYVFFRFGP